MSSFWKAEGVLVSRERGDWEGKPYFDITLKDDEEYGFRVWNTAMPIFEKMSIGDYVVAFGKIWGKYLSFQNATSIPHPTNELDQTPEEPNYDQSKEPF